MSSGNDKKNVSIVMSYCGFPASDKAKHNNEIIKYIVCFVKMVRNIWDAKTENKRLLNMLITFSWVK